LKFQVFNKFKSRIRKGPLKVKVILMDLVLMSKLRKFRAKQLENIPALEEINICRNKLLLKLTRSRIKTKQHNINSG
jgi:hypothetical protein